MYVPGIPRKLARYLSHVEAQFSVARVSDAVRIYPNDTPDLAPHCNENEGRQVASDCLKILKDGQCVRREVDQSVLWSLSKIEGGERCFTTQRDRRGEGCSHCRCLTSLFSYSCLEDNKLRRHELAVPDLHWGRCRPIRGLHP